MSQPAPAQMVRPRAWLIAAVSAACIGASVSTISLASAETPAQCAISGTVTLPRGNDADAYSHMTVRAVDTRRNYADFGTVYATTGVRPDGSWALPNIDDPTQFRIDVELDTSWTDVGSERPNITQLTAYVDPATSSEKLGASACGRADIAIATRVGGIMTGKVSVPAAAPAGWHKSVTVSAGWVQNTDLLELRLEDDLPAAQTTINADGTWTLPGMITATYSPGYRLAYTTSPVRNEQTGRMEAPVVFGAIQDYREDPYRYNITGWSSAIEGQTTTYAIDLELGTKITGTVSLPAGVDAAAYDDLKILVNNEPTSYRYAEAGVASDGYYEIGPVRAGAYPVQASAPTESPLLTTYYKSAAKVADATPVTVGDSVVSGVDFTMLSKTAPSPSASPSPSTGPSASPSPSPSTSAPAPAPSLFQRLLDLFRSFFSAFR